MKKGLSRRTFLGAAASAGAALCASTAPARAADGTGKSAAPAARPAAHPTAWPVADARDEDALLRVLRSGKWGRTAAPDGRVKEFETVFAARMQAKHCIATSSGTTALLSALGALNIGPGDEVIVPPYTFVATFNAVTASFALPVFADIDAASFQIDPAKAAAAVTRATRVILPVHIGGTPCDLDAIAEVARARKLTLLEDACQAPGAAFNGRPVGTRGIGGCFSFQASKNLTAGEGGAVLTNDDTFAAQVFNFHTPGNPKSAPATGRAANYRLTEFQAALLLAQSSRFDAQQDLRHANATYLASLLEKIPGIAPARIPGDRSRSGWHLFMARYDARQFAGLPRAKFLDALTRAGVPASSGYTALNTSAHVAALAANPHYLRIYGKDTMARWLERNRCPVNDRVVGEAFWFPQTRLLGSRSDMERIAEAIDGVRQRAGSLAAG
jgi:dTDP-4-amino-4,6-dideoxygalactose transaminase